jgi:RHS repeat-associated protein
MSLQNETKILHSYNSRNQLIKTTEGNAVKDYSYDKRGNLTGIIENGITTSSFVFNSANRMVEAITSKGKAEYEYNGFLKRVSKLETLQCNSTEIKDPLQKVKYTLDLTKPYNDLLSIGEQRFVWGNELLASEGSHNNEHFSYLNDHLGSPVRLVGNSLTETLSYDEFGVPLIDASTNISTNQSKHLNNANNFRNPFGFTGYQSDNITDLYYAQARYYYPSVGRFGATDVIKGYDIWPATLNEYAYCVNNPKKYVDLDGEFLTLIIAAVGVVAGGVIGGVSSYVKTGGAYAINALADLVWEVDKAIINNINLRVEYGAGAYTSIRVGKVFEFPLGIAVNENVTFSTAGVDRNWGTDFGYLFGNRRVITPYSSGPNYDLTHPNYRPSTGTIIQDSHVIGLPRNISITVENRDLILELGGSIYFGFGLGGEVAINFSGIKRDIQGIFNWSAQVCETGIVRDIQGIFYRSAQGCE